MTGERVIPGAAGSGQNPDEANQQNARNPQAPRGAASSAVTDAPGAGAPQGAQVRTTAPKLSRRRRLEGALFVTPAFLFQLSWGWYPLLMAFVISFTNARFRGPVEFTGLTSYLRMWRDPLVGEAFKVTAIYTVLSIVLTFMIPMVVAILLMEMPRRHIRWMMLLWFLPLSGIASTLLFRYMFNAQYGLLQWVATEVLHLSPQPFLNSGNQVLFWLVFPGILFFGPGLIYMATLQGIPAVLLRGGRDRGRGILAQDLDDFAAPAAAGHLDDC